MTPEAVEQVARAIRDATSVLAATGAGISAESGVPVFRGPGGLWRNHRPEELATAEAFARQPGVVWEWYRWRRERIRAAEPNAGHLALARLEKRAISFLLATQNVDGLHGRAGTISMVELHGNIWRSRCEHGCGFVVDESRLTDSVATANLALAVPRCVCGAKLRPDVVWFGESLDSRVLEQAMTAAERCDVLLVIGTSALVYPAAALPAIARRRGAMVVEVNVEETPLSDQADVILRGPSGTVLPAIEALV